MLYSNIKIAPNLNFLRTFFIKKYVDFQAHFRVLLLMSRQKFAVKATTTYKNFNAQTAGKLLKNVLGFIVKTSY